MKKAVLLLLWAVGTVIGCIFVFYIMLNILTHP